MFYELRVAASSLRYFIGVEVVTAVAMKSSIVWGTTPRSQFKVNWSFGEMCHLHFQVEEVDLATRFRLFSYLVYCLSLKMEETCFSETTAISLRGLYVQASRKI
jgi:hypothetical protein